MHPGTALVGCAGWSIPREYSARFPDVGSHLQRYASVFGAVEINSSFYRPHKPSTYARWAESVPSGFKFSVKLPKVISHGLRLSGADEAMASFVEETRGLGEKLHCILVQLPPLGAFVAPTAESFFSLLRQSVSCMVACEARHASWFSDSATALLQAHGVTRVQADPARGQPGAFLPTTPERYLRLHGSPRMYYSPYSEEYLADLKNQLAKAKHATWVIFDNTAAGEATGNALTLRAG